MIGRSLKIVLLASLITSLFASSLFAQTADLSILSQPNIVCGMGEHRDKDKAIKLSYIDLGAKLNTDVQITTTVNSDNDNVNFESKVVSNTIVHIHNAKQIFVKDGRKWIVYCYLDMDSPYCGYEIVDNPVTKVETSTVVVAPTPAVVPVPVSPRPVVVRPMPNSRPRVTPAPPVRGYTSRRR